MRITLTAFKHIRANNCHILTGSFTANYRLSERGPTPNHGLAQGEYVLLCMYEYDLSTQRLPVHHAQLAIAYPLPQIELRHQLRILKRQLDHLQNTSGFGLC